MEPPQHQPFPPPDPRLADPFAPPGGGPLAAPRPGVTGMRDVLVVGVAIAVVGGAGLVAGVERATRGDKVPAAAAGCGPVRDFPLPLDARHASGPVAYPDEAPYGGQHSPMPLPGFVRFVPREGAPEYVAERAVHNLEHGYVVVWYGPGASEESLDELRDALRDAPPKVIAVPWRGATGEAPHYTLAAWGHLQSCAQPTAEAIRAFYAEHGGENGDAPEKLAP